MNDAASNGAANHRLGTLYALATAILLALFVFTNGLACASGAWRATCCRAGCAVLRVERSW
jgi:hypothetical protein